MTSPKTFSVRHELIADVPWMTPGACSRAKRPDNFVSDCNFDVRAFESKRHSEL